MLVQGTFHEIFLWYDHVNIYCYNFSFCLFDYSINFAHSIIYFVSAFFSNISDTLSKLPDQEDLSGAAIALLRLQDTYDLPTENLAKGRIQGVQYSPQLTCE